MTVLHSKGVDVFDMLDGKVALQIPVAHTHARTDTHASTRSHTCRHTRRRAHTHTHTRARTHNR